MPRAVPTPRGNPLLGDTLAFGRDVLGASTRWAEQHGDLVRIRIPGLRLYQVTHPEWIETLLAGHARSLKKDWFTRSLSEILGEGLLVAEGEAWRTRRRGIQPALHPQALPKYAEAMVRAADDYAQTLRFSKQRDVLGDMMKLTARVVAIALFGHDVDEDTDALRHAMAVYTDHFAGIFGTRFRLPLSVPTPSALRVRRAFREVDAIVARLLAARARKNREPSDLLSLLLKARDVHGAPLTAKAVRDEAVTMLLAGHETSALSITYALHALAHHPEVADDVSRELWQTLGGRTPSFEDLKSLPYTMAVVKESMRLYPPVWTLGRELLADIKLGEHVLERGATVMLPQWVVHRDARWFARPLSFEPERWLDGSTTQLSRYAYFPFGAGSRMCLGSNFALVEAALVLATLLSRFAVLPLGPSDLTLVPSATLRPLGAVRLRFAPIARGHMGLSVTDSRSAKHQRPPHRRTG